MAWNEVILNSSEIRLADFIARKRYRANRRAGFADRRVDNKRTSQEIDTEGVAGEIAFCKIHNIYPDLETKHRPGYDCIVGGLRIDVKTTRFQTGRLVIPLRKKILQECDAYALMVGKSGKYRFAGWIERDKVFHEYNLIDLGYGLEYGIAQEKLARIIKL